MKFKITERNRKIVFYIVAAAMISAAAMVFIPTGKKGDVLVVKDGDSLRTIAQNLFDKHLIYSREVFVVYVTVTGQSSNLKSGKYSIPAPLSIYDLTQILINGDSGASDISLYIPEGTDIGDMDRIFADAGLINSGDLLKYYLDKEGYLFPDTYKFKPGLRDSRFDLANMIDKLQQNFDDKTQELFTGISSKDQNNAIIIASLLQKEARDKNDIYIISGIIQKRIELGMPLEIDASVAYGVCRPKFEEDKYCNVAQADLVDNIHLDSLYNTYTRKGLPAGPITNPGELAIDAALHPQSSPYLYYLHTPDGRAIFSKTGAEHVANRKKYLGF